MSANHPFYVLENYGKFKNFKPLKADFFLNLEKTIVAIRLAN